MKELNIFSQVNRIYYILHAMKITFEFLIPIYSNPVYSKTQIEKI